MLSLNFLVTCLIVVLIPGTGVIFTVSTGLTAGKRASVFAALGCTAGILPHLLASVLGLSALLHTSALAFEVLKYAGVAYLLYLAYATWRDRSAFAMNDAPAVATACSLMLRGFLLIFSTPADHFLPGFPAPVRGARQHGTCRANAGAERGVHGNDICGVCDLRPAGQRVSPRGNRVATGAELAAPQFCGGVCGAGVEPGVRAALKAFDRTIAAESSHVTAR